MPSEHPHNEERRNRTRTNSNSRDYIGIDRYATGRQSITTAIEERSTLTQPSTLFSRSPSINTVTTQNSNYIGERPDKIFIPTNSRRTISEVEFN